MKILAGLLPAAAGLAVIAALNLQPLMAAESNSKLIPKQFQFTQTRTAQVQYLLYLPEGCQEGGSKRWPLLLFLHGAGERGTNLWRVAIHGPPKLVSLGSNFPFIVVAPQCPEGQRWSNDIVLALLDEVMRTLPVDAARVYLTGLSMGGYGTWSLGCAHPEKFAAIVPICGGGQMIDALLSSREKAQALRSLGVWAFHGAKDPVVPLQESQRMVDALKRLGVTDIKLTVYPEANHDSWTQTYLNPELYDWLLRHQRGD